MRKKKLCRVNARHFRYLGTCFLTFQKLFQTQLKALNLSKAIKGKNKAEAPASQRSKSDKEVGEETETVIANGDDDDDGR